MNNFEGKRILVTGGASGIGLATVNHFLKIGAKVASFDINRESLNKLRHKVESPEHLLVIEGDVRQKDHISKSLDLIIDKWKGIDILVYSAGIFPDCRITEMSEEDWDQVLDINLKGAFITCRKVARRMIKQGDGGHIVTISSGSYQSARIGSGHYCASKAGLVMLTKVLAIELAKNRIQVNSIAPGLVESERLDLSYIEKFCERIPFARPANPSEVSSAIEMVTSSLNTYMTGQVIAVDGGLSSGHYGLPNSNKSL
ncbi:SDR family NAD(P)-dependent oxidoreductase [Pseudalkalibacillus sp. A8]|uniref:SDR family NAD(P)-dependent oxidoreductase n=1 Tax=Pseudalkalibacillus sp. A8 TaxID=3382641 RepID=UPI0038B4AA84